MAVNRVSQKEIVEVSFLLPGEKGLKNHPVLVLSGEELLREEDMFYGVLMSSKNYHPKYTLEVKDEWLSRPMFKSKGTSFFVTHIVTYFKLSDVIKSSNTYVKEEFFGPILDKVINSMFELEAE